MEGMSYPIDKMRSVAQNIRTSANNALTNHHMHWQRVQNCIDRLPGFMQSPLYYVLDPHDRRLRNSYQWQLDFADALEKAANDMDDVDQQVKQAF